MKSVNAIVIALIVIGLVLGIGLLTLEEFEKTLGTNVTTVSNETIVPTDEGIYVTNNHTTSGVFCYNSFSVTSMVNETSTEVVASGNYSFEPATGRIANISSYSSNVGWNVSYTYSHSDSEACSGINDTITATATIPAWLTIIVLILIVGIILYLVFRFAGGYSGRGSGGTIAQV